MTEPIHEIVFERLAADSVPTEVAEVVLAALSGDEDLAAALRGELTRLDTPPVAEPLDRPTGIYLTAVTVAGFRGIGPERTLSLRPAAGLTVVVGRNGSGKSSFAEAIELTLTGDSARWAARTSVWRTGWRNVHTGDPCAITAELRVDGVAEPVRIRRSWATGTNLDGAVATVGGPYGRKANLADLGLARPLELYRPFLTAAEFGQLLAGNPSEMFDALDRILGLDALNIADKRLLATARPLETAAKTVRADRDALAVRLAEVDDERARRAADTLASRTPDLAKLDAILDEPADHTGDDAEQFVRQMRDLAPPDPDQIADLVAELRTNAEAARGHDDDRSRRSVRVAEMLRLALDHQGDTGDGPCPVCRTGTLDATWRTDAAVALNDLRVSTLAGKRATDQLAATVRRARALIGAIATPAPDAGPTVPDLGQQALRGAIEQLHAAPAGDPAALADHLAKTYPPVGETAAGVRDQAAAWLDRRDATWRQIADELRLWIAAARQAGGHELRLTVIKKARGWLKASNEELRNERFAPFAEHSQRIWRQLRQDSNVELGRMTLAGANTNRRIVVPVSVDGAESGTGLGVMSQGELHALGLAAFLPRSCAAESPFRFIVIDDPVQSMDPAKVDGLAHVLAELATDRQVIVFTHDNRLPDAVRHLEIDAAIVEIVRAENSIVTVRPAHSTVKRYLDDARAVARADDIAPVTRAPVVAELCRSALEAACHDVVWRRRLARGDKHADIEAAITAAGRSVAETFALALFDDASRGGDVLTKLNRQYGPQAADAYQASRRGVHGSDADDLPGVVRSCERLADALR